MDKAGAVVSATVQMGLKGVMGSDLEGKITNAVVSADSEVVVEVALKCEEMMVGPRDEEFPEVKF